MSWFINARLRKERELTHTESEFPTEICEGAVIKSHLLPPRKAVLSLFFFLLLLLCFCKSQRINIFLPNLSFPSRNLFACDFLCFPLRSPLRYLVKEFPVPCRNSRNLIFCHWSFWRHLRSWLRRDSSYKKPRYDFSVYDYAEIRLEARWTGRGCCGLFWRTGMYTNRQ